jgi:amino acid transporter
VTSWFASVLAFHNAAARYVFALGRDGVLPAFWGRTSPRFGSPWTASLGHSAFTLVVVLAFVVVQADPYLDLYVLGSTPAVVGIPVLELLASVAVFAYFARDRRGLPAWQVLVCPLVAAAALAVVVWLIVDQIDLFTARTGVVNVVLPGLILLTLAAGLGRALALRNRRPEVYAALGSTARPPDRVTAPARPTRGLRP